jgi:PCFT/HCP family folate transporter-like MFS transporter 1/3
VAFAVPSIVATLAFGAWSDRVGRKVVISLPAIGLSANAGCVVLVWYLHLPIPVLFAGQIISGILGGYGSFNMAVFAYMSDITASASRTTRIGIVESMIYLGGMFGNIIGGLWIKQGNFGPAFSCISAAGLAVLIYVIAIICEPRDQSLGYKYKKCQTFFSCRNMVKAARLFMQSKHLYWPLILAISVFFCASINFAGMLDVVVLYVYDWPLCWSSDRLGYFMALKLGTNGVSTLVLLPLMKSRGLSDFSVIYLGLTFGAGSLVLMGLASHTWMMYLVPVIGAVRGSVVPTLRSLMSKMVNEDDHGALFALVACIEVVCNLLATVIFNSMYPATRYLVTPHGFCFFFMAGMLIIALVITV